MGGHFTHHHECFLLPKLKFRHNNAQMIYSLYISSYTFLILLSHIFLVFKYWITDLTSQLVACSIFFDILIAYKNNNTIRIWCSSADSWQISPCNWVILTSASASITVVFILKQILLSKRSLYSSLFLCFYSKDNGESI